MGTLGTLPVISQIKQAVLLLLVTATAACVHLDSTGDCKGNRPTAKEGGWCPGRGLSALLPPVPVDYGIEMLLQQGDHF